MRISKDKNQLNSLLIDCLLTKQGQLFGKVALVDKMKGLFPS